MGAAEDLFKEIVEGRYGRIDQFVRDGTWESLHVDFKQKQNSSHGIAERNDIKNYSKALSGFANSDGGVIVWGVECKPQSPGDPDVASQLRPITQHQAFMTSLNALGSQLVARSVESVQNLSIDDPATNSGFVATLIPASDYAPHRAEAKDVRGIYFKRNLSNFIQMEHFELEDMFGRRRKAILSADCRVGVGATAGGRVRDIGLQLVVRNTGRFLAQHLAVRIDEWPGTSQPGTGWQRLSKVFALSSDNVLHPTQEMVAVTGALNLDEPRILALFRVSGDLLSANSTPSRFEIEYTRAQITEFAGQLPDWAWAPPGVPIR
jgi:hypothetical protein